MSTLEYKINSCVQSINITNIVFIKNFIENKFIENVMVVREHHNPHPPDYLDLGSIVGHNLVIDYQA